MGDPEPDANGANRIFTFERRGRRDGRAATNCPHGTLATKNPPDGGIERALGLECGVSGAEAAIEDLFEPGLLTRTIKGRIFDRTGKKKDPSKWYSKVDFATQIVKPERSTINFSGFEPLLKAISDARNDFAIRGATTAQAPVASAAE
jgi:hypothetical protein